MTETFLNDHFKVLPTTTTSNWLKSVALGSALLPVICFLPDLEEFDWGMVFIYFWIFIPSFFLSLISSLPAFLVFLFAGYLLNRRKLPFAKYVLLQNAVHLLVAVTTFAIADYFELIDSDIRRLLWQISITYTVSGLFIWNKMYYRIYKNELF
jgi:hypothetical protein